MAKILIWLFALAFLSMFCYWLVFDSYMAAGLINVVCWAVFISGIAGYFR